MKKIAYTFIAGVIFGVVLTIAPWFVARLVAMVVMCVAVALVAAAAVAVWCNNHRYSNVYGRWVRR